MNERSKKLLKISLILASVILVGTIGYARIEGWNFFDSFYMTIITITTVGFSETHKLSPQGRLFTVILIALGYVVIAIAVAYILKFIVESEFKDLLSRKKTKKMVGKMKNHYIICGYGNIGKAISVELKKNNIPFVIIDQSDEAVMAAEEEYAVIKGNMTQDQTLIDAGVARAAGVVACAPADTDNLLISLASRELNPMLFIIAKGEDPGVESRILRAGADIVVSPLKLGGQQVANLLIKQIGGSSLEQDGLSAASIDGFSLERFTITSNRPLSVEAALRKNGAVKGVAIKRRDGSLDNDVDNDTILNEGDSLIAVTYVKEQDTEHASVSRKNSLKRILIADDHRGLRSLFTKKLAAEGNIIVEAQDGNEAIAKAKDGKYDLIILDVVMPLKSGFEVCRDIRTHAPDVPIILYSSDESPEFIRKGKEVGATACVRKTNKSHDLLVKVNELINKNPVRDGAAGEELADLVDLEQLGELTGGDAETMREVFQMFFEDSKPKLEQLSQAVATRNLEEIKNIGHYFKGGAANMGMASVTETAQALEMAASNGDNTAVAIHSDRLRKEIERVEKAYAKAR